jgi:hypothetical protein
MLAGESSTRRWLISLDCPLAIRPITITFAAARCCARFKPTQLAAVAPGLAEAEIAAAASVAIAPASSEAASNLVTIVRRNIRSHPE